MVAIIELLSYCLAAEMVIASSLLSIKSDYYSMNQIGTSTKSFKLSKIELKVLFKSI